MSTPPKDTARVISNSLPSLLVPPAADLPGLRAAAILLPTLSHDASLMDARISILRNERCNGVRAPVRVSPVAPSVARGLSVTLQLDDA